MLTGGEALDPRPTARDNGVQSVMNNEAHDVAEHGNGDERRQHHQPPAIALARTHDCAPHALLEGKTPKPIAIKARASCSVEVR
jgi:hypothetical protein